MQAGIRSYADHPLIGEARGIGLIGAVEIVRDKTTKQSFDPKAGVAAYLVRRAQHHGAILRNMPGDIVAFSPPLVISEAEIDEMMGCFGKALDDTWAMVKEKGPRVTLPGPAPRGRRAGADAMAAQKTIIVTGASRGIGHATALRFHAKAGA